MKVCALTYALLFQNTLDYVRAYWIRGVDDPLLAATVPGFVVPR